MDPNAALQTLIFVIEDLQYAHNVQDQDDKNRRVQEAREIWNNLHEWMERGGFAPSDDYGMRVVSRYMRLVVRDMS